VFAPVAGATILDERRDAMKETDLVELNRRVEELHRREREEERARYRD
jgi:hypothetical protein